MALKPLAAGQHSPQAACFTQNGFTQKEFAMLVLSRKRHEKIVVTGGIEIEIVEIRGDKVRLGFEAPDDVRIFREEVLERIKENEIDHATV